MVERRRGLRTVGGTGRKGSDLWAVWAVEGADLNDENRVQSMPVAYFTLNPPLLLPRDSPSLTPKHGQNLQPSDDYPQHFR